jgi:hypothetical protein
VIDQATIDLLNQHASIAKGRFRFPWQADPGSYLDQISYRAHAACSGDADAADRVTQDIVTTHNQLTANADEGFGLATGDLEAWTGSAARDFKKYLYQVQSAVDRFDDVLHDLVKIQNGYAALVRETKNNVTSLLEAAIQAQNEESREEGWTIALTAVEVAAGALASALSWGTAPVAWLVVTTAVSGTASVASVTISTAGPGETAASLDDGLYALLTDVGEQSDRFFEAYQELDGAISGSASLPIVNPPAPSFITAPSFDPSTFDLPCDIEPTGIEQRVRRDQLVKPPQPQNAALMARLNGGA